MKPTPVFIDIVDGQVSWQGSEGRLAIISLKHTDGDTRGVSPNMHSTFGCVRNADDVISMVLDWLDPHVGYTPE